MHRKEKEKLVLGLSLAPRWRHIRMDAWMQAGMARYIAAQQAAGGLRLLCDPALAHARGQDTHMALLNYTRMCALLGAVVRRRAVQLSRACGANAERSCQGQLRRCSRWPAFPFAAAGEERRNGTFRLPSTRFLLSFLMFPF